MLGRAEEAVPAAARAVASAESAESWIEFATSLHALADLEEERYGGRPSAHRDDALGTLARATELEPANAVVWERTGEVLLYFGLAEEALPRFERAIDLGPRRPKPWLLKAKALAELGRDHEAETALHRGTRIARLGLDDDARPESPLAAVMSLGRPLLTFVWREKRGVALTVVLYVLGLVVWSLNAARRDLGLQAAADLQYLVAGAAPAAVLALALALLVAWFRLPAWSRDRLLRWRPREAGAIAAVGGWLVAGGSSAIAVFGWSGLLDRWPILLGTAVGAFALGTILTGLTRRGGALFALIWYGYGALGIVTLAFVAFTFYANVLYPRLPQSLGGGKPRCAQLDVDAGSISGATLAALAPGATGSTVRTAKLDIVFAQGDLVFVKRPHEERLIALRSGAVRAVIGCG
jgi:Flp pilus assembly protein TadD